MVSVGQVLIPQSEDSRFVTSRVVALGAGADLQPGAWLFKIRGKGHLPQWRSLAEIEGEIGKGTLSATTWAPSSCTLPVSALSKRHKDLLRKATQALKHLQEESPNLSAFLIPGGKNGAIRRVAEKCETHTIFVRRVLFRYWRNGMTTAALRPPFGVANKGKGGKEGQKRRGRRGDPEGSQLALSDAVKADVRRLILQRIAQYGTRRNLYYQVLGALGPKVLNDAGEDVVSLPTGDRFVSASQFRRILDALNKDGSVDRALQGSAQYDLEKSTSLLAPHEKLASPGDEYQIDDSGTQVEIVSVNGDPIGPAFILLVADTVSKLVTGVHCDIGTSTSEAHALAFFNSIMPKREFCAAYGIQIEESEWPASGVPMGYLGDKGTAYSSDRTGSYVISLPIVARSAPVQAGDDKGVVENLFFVIKSQLLRHVKGYRPKAGQRGAGNPKKKAALTLYELRRLVIKWILKYNKRALPQSSVPVAAQLAKVKPTPLEIWNWGLSQGTGSLIQLTPEELWTSLLPLEHARVTDHGIEFKNFSYTAEEFEQNRFYARAKHSPMVLQVRADVQRPDQIHVYLDKENRFVTCRRIRKSALLDKATHADAAAMDASHRKAAKGINKENLKDEVQLAVDIGLASRKATARARAHAAGIKAPRSARTSDLRKKEQDRVREEDISNLQTKSPAPPETPDDAPPVRNRKTRQDIEDKLLAMLEKKAQP